MPLDKESIKVLGSVKKGRAAKFVMITTGSEVTGLCVYRKGSDDAAKLRAKEQGSGKASSGVVTGKGAKIVFNFLKSEGYSDVPANPKKLRDYINDSDPSLNVLSSQQLIDTPIAVEMEAAEGEPGARGFPGRISPPVPEFDPPPPVPLRSEEDAESQLMEQEAEEMQAPLVPELSVPEVVRDYLDRAAWDLQIQQARAAAGIEAQTAALKLLLKTHQEQLAAVRGDAAWQADDPDKLAQDQLLSDVADELKTWAADLRGNALRQAGEGIVPPLGVPPSSAGEIYQEAFRKTKRLQAGLVQKLATDAVGIAVAAPYAKDDLQDILRECNASNDSEFSRIASCALIHLDDASSSLKYDELQQKITDGIQLATAYLASHDRRDFLTPDKVIKRKRYCTEFIKGWQKLRNDVEEANETAQKMAQTCSSIVRDNRLPIPGGVIDELEKLLQKPALSAPTMALVEQALRDVTAAAPAAGYAELRAMNDPSRKQVAEVMLRQRCYKAALSGTSDVKLLRHEDGSIAFAFKATAGESSAALDKLGLEEGGCTIREELCSATNDIFLEAAGIDLGFPKSKVVSVDGKVGALIDGVRGKMIDPEEIVLLKDAIADAAPGSEEQKSLQAALDEARQLAAEVPQTLNPKSLQKAITSMLLTNQWDAKWGNMIIEGTNVRPLDGGAGFPTQKLIDDMDRALNRRRLSSALQLVVSYPLLPLIVENPGKPLPAAQQPMDEELVKGIVELDVDAMVQALRAKKDAILLENPGIAGSSGHDLLPDVSLHLTADAARAMQAILQATPDITLYDFVKSYEAWLKGWLKENSTAGKAARHAQESQRD